MQSSSKDENDVAGGDRAADSSSSSAAEAVGTSAGAPSGSGSGSGSGGGSAKGAFRRAAADRTFAGAVALAPPVSREGAEEERSGRAPRAEGGRSEIGAGDADGTAARTGAGDAVLAGAESRLPSTSGNHVSVSPLAGAGAGAGAGASAGAGAGAGNDKDGSDSTERASFVSSSPSPAAVSPFPPSPSPPAAAAAAAAGAPAREARDKGGASGAKEGGDDGEIGAESTPASVGDRAADEVAAADEAAAAAAMAMADASSQAGISLQQITAACLPTVVRSFQSSAAALAGGGPTAAAAAAVNLPLHVPEALAPPPPPLASPPAAAKAPPHNPIKSPLAPSATAGIGAGSASIGSPAAAAVTSHTSSIGAPGHAASPATAPVVLPSHSGGIAAASHVSPPQAPPQMEPSAAVAHSPPAVARPRSNSMPNQPPSSSTARFVATTPSPAPRAQAAPSASSSAPASVPSSAAATSVAVAPPPPLPPPRAPLAGAPSVVAASAPAPPAAPPVAVIAAKPPLRRGKWTVEEESYVARVIQEFNSGYLHAPAGTTLRTYLSEKLHCDPMRITKKFTGDSCIGKRVFHPAVRCAGNAAAIDRARSELDALERRWRRRLEMQQKESAKKAAASAAAAAAAASSGHVRHHHHHQHHLPPQVAAAAVASSRLRLSGSAEALTATAAVPPAAPSSAPAAPLPAPAPAPNAPALPPPNAPPPGEAARGRIVAQTASWLERANAILAGRPVANPPAVPDPVAGAPTQRSPPPVAGGNDGSGSVETQMREVRQLISEGPTIRQSTAGLPGLLQTSSSSSLPTMAPAPMGEGHASGGPSSHRIPNQAWQTVDPVGNNTKRKVSADSESVPPSAHTPPATGASAPGGSIPPAPTAAAPPPGGAAPPAYSYAYYSPAPPSGADRSPMPAGAVAVGSYGQDEGPEEQDDKRPRRLSPPPPEEGARSLQRGDTSPDLAAGAAEGAEALVGFLNSVRAQSYKAAAADGRRLSG